MRSSIVSPIKSLIDKPISAGSPLFWSYSVLTPLADTGKIVFSASSLYNFNSAGSLSIWAKIPTGGVKVFIELYTSTNDRTSLYFSSDALTVAQVRGGFSALNSPTGFTNDGLFHHYVAAWDVNSYTVYVDGNLKATFSQDATMTLSSPQLCVSGALSTSAFPAQGNFLGLAAFKTKLTSLQVSGLYRANQIPSSCVSRWDFNTGFGTTISPNFGPGATSGTLGTGDTWSAIVPIGRIRSSNDGIVVGE